MNIYTIILLLFISSANIYCQDPPRPVVFVKNINMSSIDTTYIPYMIIDKYIYKLEITIKSDGQLFNFPLAITCHYDEDQKRTIIVNQNRSITIKHYWSETVEELFKYYMVIETYTKGIAKISLSKWDPINLKVDNESKIIFEDFVFSLE